MPQTSKTLCDAFFPTLTGMSLALIQKDVLRRIPSEGQFVTGKRAQRLPLRQRRSQPAQNQLRSRQLSGNLLSITKTCPCAQEKTRLRRPRAKQLIQGSIPGPARKADDDLTQPSYPTVVQQARNNINSFENCVVLTRVGSFYEVS